MILLTNRRELNKGDMMAVTKVCPICNREFTTSTPNKKYCCPECKRQAINAKEREYYANNSEAIKLRLKIKKSTSAEDTQRYLEAYSKIEKPKIILTCQMCGKTFEAKSTKQRFCSAECSAKNDPIRKREWRLRKLGLLS